MTKKSWTYGIMAAASLAVATPALAQSVEIGPNGVRVVPNDSYRYRDHRDHGRYNRRDERHISEISEHEAVRIARRQGMRDVRAITRTPRSFRVAGADRRGDRMSVSIDRFSGEVLSVR
ncbi:PepSY domain-containing protein [Jiella sp. M17.18]|uniref:PepSY domain-containing protein n=1 Tax=Jiella sp. M17.18 TaxID=3234247 RepID=UPI0034DE4927